MTMLASGSDDPGKAIVPAQENTAALEGASAQSDADRIRQRVKEGQKVRITDDQGREWHGRIGTLTPDSLTVVTDDRERKDLPYGTILRIDRPHDSLANGALIGFASGAALGLGVVIGEESNDCEPGVFFSCGEPTGGAYVAGPLVFGGLGAAVGVGIDALIRKDPRLFQRTGPARVTLAPAVGRVSALSWCLYAGSGTARPERPVAPSLTRCDCRQQSAPNATRSGSMMSRPPA